MGGLSKQAIIGMPEDFPIEDADEEIEITVIESDIKLGKQRSPSQCAFARAERRVEKDIVRVEALKTTLYLVYRDHAVRYRLSRKAMDAIRAFDDAGGKKMIPGTYTLKPISPEYASMRTGIRTGKSTGRNKSKTDSIAGWIRGKGPKK